MPMGQFTPPMMSVPMQPSMPMTMPAGSAGRGGSRPVQPPMLGTPQCTPQVPLSTECAACTCTAASRDGADCGAAVSQCDAQCWALLRCIYNRCSTVFSDACLFEACAEYASATPAVQRVAWCVDSCTMLCSWDLQVQPGADTDAGI